MQTAGVGGAFPRHYYSQQRVASALKRHRPAGVKKTKDLDRLFARVGVKRRHLALPDEVEVATNRRQSANCRYGNLAAMGPDLCAELVLLRW